MKQHTMRNESRRRFRSALGLALIAASLLLTAACSDNDKDDPEPTPVSAREFWGPVASSPALVSLREESGPAGKQVSIFLTDGFPNGLSEFFSGPVASDNFNLTSVSGGAVIEGSLPGTTGGVRGTVRLPDGTTRNIALTRTRLGAGRYRLSIDASGRWTGTGPDGNVLTAQQTGSLVTGSITTTPASPEPLDFQLHDLSRTLAFGATGSQPGQYTVFVSTRANNIIGRGGAVSSGAPNANFVNLDLPITPEVLSGVFFGRLRFQTDVLLVDVNEPTVAGDPRSVRAYVSDGEPEPEGDVEWFQGTFSGDSFSLTSASGDAQIQATVSASGVSGSVTYGSGPALPLFAGPAGQGAGVYDVTVDGSNRLTGTSEEGGRIDFVRNDFTVDGTITTPAGTVFATRIHDLVRGLRYPNFEQIATVPDTYVAFVSPRARYIVGRSGNVRGGSGGLNIIGLDKACASAN